MDDFLQLQKSDNPIILYVVVPVVALLVLYLVIRVAVTLSIRDHERRLESRRFEAARTRCPAERAFPPIAPGTHETS